MDLILQFWGGLFYLANKILFALAERQAKAQRRQLKLIGWLVYILGVPAWVIIMIDHNNWIAAAIEAGGVPAMLLGLYNTYQGKLSASRLINHSVAAATYAAVAFGLIYSLLLNGGVTSLSQVLELGIMTGFLLGSYFLAKSNPVGWLFFMLMNLSMATLMGLQGKPILMTLQLLSFSFVFYGFIQVRYQS
ncbi:MAG: hypothetical protein R3227_05295 [Reinekea sp.]|nr:hypothetical protein [Reinekea sp.]